MAHFSKNACPQVKRNARFVFGERIGRKLAQCPSSISPGPKSGYALDTMTLVALFGSETIIAQRFVSRVFHSNKFTLRVLNYNFKTTI
jgi:hypothetical protein